MSRDDARREAEESIAPRFTRLMRASTSPLGMLTDPPLVGVAESIIVLAAILAYRTGLVGEGAVPVLFAVAAAPLVVAAGATLAIRGARAKVVDWLASLPFPLENVNGLLNGVALTLLVRFTDTPPDRDALNAELEKVHPDCFALEYHDSEPEVEVRIGVLESKMNPAGVHYRRYERVHQLVDGCLVRLHDTHPIESVRVE